jgi:uncharacterized protein with PIN domain
MGRRGRKIKLPLLLADRMLGKLVRYLRIAGFDTLYVGPEKNPLEETRRTGRTLLTRNRSIASRCNMLGLSCILVDNNYPHDQTREVLEKLGDTAQPEPYTRCVFCNSVLVNISNKEEVEGWVPPFVYSTQEQFKKCPDCGRVFWDATHKESMEKFIKSVLK